MPSSQKVSIRVMTGFGKLINSDRPDRIHAPVTVFIVMLITIVFIAGSRGFGIPPQSYLDALGLVPSDQPSAQGFYRFLSYAFVHFNVGHWLLNIGGLLCLGIVMEHRIRSFQMVFFVILSAIVAGLAHVLVYQSSPLPLMGASGVVAALLGFVMIHCLRGRVFGVVLNGCSVIILVALTHFVIQQNLALPTIEQPSHIAHIAGLAFGIAWGGFRNGFLRNDKVGGVGSPSA